MVAVLLLAAVDGPAAICCSCAEHAGAGPGENRRPPNHMADTAGTAGTARASRLLARFFWTSTFLSAIFWPAIFFPTRFCLDGARSAIEGGAVPAAKVLELAVPWQSHSLSPL